MTGDSANFADTLLSGRISTARLWIGQSLDRRTPKIEVTAFLWCNSLLSAHALSRLLLRRTHNGFKQFILRKEAFHCTDSMMKLEFSLTLQIRQFTIRWFAGLLGHMTCRSSV